MKHNLRKAFVFTSFAISSLLASACGEDLSERSELAVATPSILAKLNTCDGQQLRLTAPGQDRFVLDGADGRQRFKTTKLGIEKKNCVVAVQFNVPNGFKAQLRLATTAGSGKAKVNTSNDFIMLAGFAKNRPIAEADLNTGRHIGEFKKLLNGQTTSFDLQLDQRDGLDLERTATDCGQRNVWFYVHSSVKTEQMGNSDVSLDFIHGSFKLIPCS